MNVAELFIRRPVMTTLVMMAILLFGVVAYQQLPVSDPGGTAPYRSTDCRWSCQGISQRP